MVRGALYEGGLLTDKSEPIYLDYMCKRGGVSAIQMTIEMERFKNINLFFEKECPLIKGEGGSGILSTLALLMFMLFVILAFITIYNVFVHD